ncbi:MAG: imidazolonepropionase-like amidohydrolase [Chlamydiales bacterium]|jgi:imidazolonepropionase-like amidohydrolase
MSPMDALVAATSTAAKLCGLGGEIGALEAGRIAGLIGLAGNPPVDIHAMTEVSFVMARGKVFTAD